MATNWNAILANINNASDILAILRKVLSLLDGKVDLTRIDEIIEELTFMKSDVSTALGSVSSALNAFDIESQAAIQDVIASGLMEGFTTEAELLASRPTVAKKYAKAEDTDVIWFWNKPEGSPDGNYWVSTGLSELDRAKSYADGKHLITMNLLYSKTGIEANKQTKALNDSLSLNLVSSELSKLNILETDNYINQFQINKAGEKLNISVNTPENSVIDIKKLVAGFNIRNLNFKIIDSANTHEINLIETENILNNVLYTSFIDAQYRVSNRLPS